MTLIFKICSRTLWQDAEKEGAFDGAPIDVQDGYIHFSTRSQVQETAAKHFAGQDNLLLIAVEGDHLGGNLRYEPSRGGELFPHLYGPLPLSAVVWVKLLPLGPDGLHLFPDLTA